MDHLRLVNLCEPSAAKKKGRETANRCRISHIAGLAQVDLRKFSPSPSLAQACLVICESFVWRSLYGDAMVAVMTGYSNKLAQLVGSDFSVDGRLGVNELISFFFFNHHPHKF